MSWSLPKTLAWKPTFTSFKDSFLFFLLKISFKRNCCISSLLVWWICFNSQIFLNFTRIQPEWECSPDGQQCLTCTQTQRHIQTCSVWRSHRCFLLLVWQLLRLIRERQTGVLPNLSLKGVWECVHDVYECVSMRLWPSSCKQHSGWSSVRYVWGKHDIIATADFLRALFFF